MLHQDPLVFGPFTVLDNFLLASPGGVRLDRKRGAEQLAAAAERYGFTFDPDAEARTLSVGERQQLEIARLLWLGARLLIFDEPTTGISASQRDKLFDILRRLAGDGLMVIFVSHKLEEIEQLCDRVTIMRRGTVVGREDMPVPARTPRRADVRRASSSSPTGPAITDRQAAAASRRTSPSPTASTPATSSLDVAEGEVLGLAGLEGSGQRTFLRGCAGLDRRPTGAAMTRRRRRPHRARRYGAFLDAGVHLLPAGRLEEGLVPGPHDQPSTSSW